MERVRLSAKFWTFLEVIPSATLIIVLGFGAVAAGQGQLTLGSLVAFITLMLSLVWPVAALGFLLAMTQEAMTAADRIMEIFDAEIDIADGTETLDRPARPGALHRRRVPLSRRRRGRAAPREPARSSRARPSPWSAPPARARPILTQLVPRLYDVTAARSASTVSTSAT